jgi:cytochrome P450
MTQAETSPAGFGIALSGNPYPIFEQLRKNMPVTKLGEGGFWAVSRYEDVVRVLRDPDTFSSIVGAKAIAGEAQPSLLFNDPPMHTRLRALIAKAFTPRVVEQQRPAITDYCERLVGAMCAKDDADLVLELAYPLPVMVIANMLGVAAVTSPPSSAGRTRSSRTSARS